MTPVPLTPAERDALVLCAFLFAGGCLLIAAGLILNPPLALWRRLTQ